MMERKLSAQSQDESVDSLLDDGPPTKPEHKRSSVRSDGSNNSSSSTSSSSLSPTRNRSGLAGNSSGNSGIPTKFQFYKSITRSPGGSVSVTASTDSPSDNVSRGSDDALDVAIGVGRGGSSSSSRGGLVLGAGGAKNKHKADIVKYPIPDGAAAIAAATSASGNKYKNKKGVDPPEKELPTTRFLQMQRELQLQSGAHHTNPSHQTLMRDGSSYHIPLSSGRKGGEKSSLVFPDSNDAWNDDNSDDYPNGPMDPIESDEDLSPMVAKKDHPLAAAVVSALAAAHSAASPRPTPSTMSAQQYNAMYRSPGAPGSSRNTNNSQYQNSIQYPRSAHSLPHNVLPPQQLMQYLHSGGGGSSDGVGCGFGLQRGQHPYNGAAVADGVISPPFQSNGGPNQKSSSSTMSHSFTRRSSHGHQFQQQQQQGGPIFKRRSSDYSSHHHLYSDGIDLLKKTASEAQEREEVDTLNLGINYLQKMETAMEKGEGRTQNQQQYFIPPPPLQQHRPQHQQQQQHHHQQAQHHSPRKGAPPSPASLARMHPPPPKGNKTEKARSASLGVHDMLSINESSASVWQEQQQQEGGRTHRPPPPPKPMSMSNPCTPVTYNRPRLGITAADAMNYVLNASVQPPFRRAHDDSEVPADGRSGGQFDEIRNDQSSKDMEVFLTNLLRGDHGEARAKDNDDNVGHANNRSSGSTQKKFGLPRNNAADDGVSTNSPDQDDDDFEHNTSLSKYAEDKHGLPSCDRSPSMSGKSLDPPEDDDETNHGDADFELHLKHNSSIHLPTAQYEEFSVEVDSVDRDMLPHLASHDEDINGSISSANKTNALGPRSQQPGGTTGIVLEDGFSARINRDYAGPTKIATERLQREPSLSDSSQNSSDVDDDPQSVLDDVDGELRQKSNNHSSSEGLSREENDGEAIMMKLCTHLFPDGMDVKQNSSLASLITLDSIKLEWDDEDPDEPGYVVHRLTKSQLMGIENAFDTIVAPLLKHRLEGSTDNNFEHDLEEAEVVLDKEERQLKLEAEKKNNATELGKESELESLTLQVKDMLRESVPGFPGIYHPGKGQTGDMECFYLPIITSSQKTGFEPTKDIVLKPGIVFAKNYLVQGELGSAAFSTAYRCLDLCSEVDEDGFQDEVCLKVIKNTKDYFDQSLDEIKILQLLKDTGRVKENNIVEMKSYFYHREHLVIVTELLRQNLYEFGKSIVESEGPLYFTRMRLSHIIRQCLIALKFVHELGLMHCDIKPENILLCSYSRALVKIIDFGSSSFTTDRQSSYIQSRSYRAPEVILGLPYDGKIDLWSLGCVVAEMYTNEVTFQNDSEVSMLSRIEAICGPFPRHMIANGRNSHRIFTDCGLIYEQISPEDDSSEDETDKSLFDVYQPKMTTISARLGFDEDLLEQSHRSEDDKQRASFADFVRSLLTIDPDKRPTAAEALNHPWIKSSLDLTEEDIRYQG
ncbi:hypothetical protein ACHAXH_008035 [Discostella pseudostelligera]